MLSDRNSEELTPSRDGDEPALETEAANPERAASEADDAAGEADDAAEEAAESAKPAKPAKPEAVLPRSTADDALPTAEESSGASEVDLPFEWYVIRVQSGREDTLSSKIARKLTLASLDDFVRNITVPKQKVTEMKEGKKKVRDVKLYPGYFFMEMQLVEEIWYLLRDTPGVGDFVGGGQKPMPMTAQEVKKLLDVLEERESDEPPEIKIEVDKNDTVKIKEGPFENFEGIVEEVQPTKGLIRVMVTIFGRETPVDLEYWQVEKV